MGCDIHSFAEVRREGRWEAVGDVFPLDEHDQAWKKKTHDSHPFDWRSYGLFGFLANVRNYSYVPSLSDRRGVPGDVSDTVRMAYEHWDADGHSASWLSLAELAGFDYDATFEDRRTTKQTGPNSFDGAADAGAGSGKQVTFREFLGSSFFRDLDVLKTLGEPDNVRIVFWFDN
jgi:hypothetical protein